MICSNCHGRRLVFVNGLLLPCQECGGVGELNCCEGLQAQPEPDGDALDQNAPAAQTPPAAAPSATPSSIQPE